MSRHGRAQFLAYGVLGLLNVAAMLLYGLGLGTRGSGSERAVPAIIVVAGLALIIVFVAAVRRGHDLGWSAWLTGACFWVSLGLGPLALIPVGYLAAKTGDAQTNAYGPPPPHGGAATWLRAILLLVVPWLFVVGAGLLA